MKLELVDKKNSNLICVFTVNDVMFNKILIYFDGWEDIYDYWCDITFMNIYFVGWCEKNGKLFFFFGGKDLQNYYLDVNFF